MMLKKFALVRNGTIQSTFETEKEIHDFPDIAPELVDITGTALRDNDVYPPEDAP